MLVLDLIYRDHKEGIETRGRRIAIDVTVRNKCAMELGRIAVALHEAQKSSAQRSCHHILESFKAN